MHAVWEEVQSLVDENGQRICDPDDEECLARDLVLHCEMNCGDDGYESEAEDSTACPCA